MPHGNHMRRRHPHGPPSTQPRHAQFGAAAKAPPVPRERKVDPEGVFRLLIAPLEQALAEEGYKTPTPIQAEAIEPILAGRDLIGTAQTGTGKTAAFLLPVLQRLHESGMRPTDNGRPRVVILSPTRELAAQIGECIGTYARHLKMSHTLITGGVGQGPQVQALRRGVDLVVATPGRFLDLSRQKQIDTRASEVFVLDEVDRMLDMGFLPDIKSIIANLPPVRQSLFFSATMTPQIEVLAKTLTRNPVRVSITPEVVTTDRIDQSVLFVAKGNKDALLLSLLNDHPGSKIIVFTQMKHMANKVTEKLAKAGIRGAALHGNKSQSARTHALKQFTDGNVRVLVATDVAARGIDVDGITHVVNYDLPIEPENYVHRIGRTARAGASGRAVSFCCGEDRNLLRGIEKLLKGPIPVHEKHPYHCEVSRHAKGENPMARRGGGGGGGRSQGRRGGGGYGGGGGGGGQARKAYGVRGGPGRVG